MAVSSQLRLIDHGITFDLAAGTDAAVFDHTVRADLYAVFQNHITFKHTANINYHIRTHGQGTAYVDACRIGQRDTITQQLIRLLALINAFQTGQLQTVVHTLHFVFVLRVNRPHRHALFNRHGNHIGQIIFALSIIGGQLWQPLIQQRR